MPKRIHELAKEWNRQSRELIASLETLGSTGKRSQSRLQEGDIERLAVGGEEADAAEADGARLGRRDLREGDAQVGRRRRRREEQPVPAGPQAEGLAARVSWEQGRP